MVTRAVVALLLAALELSIQSKAKPLTQQQCASYDSTGNFATATQTLDAVDAALLGAGKFARVVRGELKIRGGPAVNVSNNGGGTNPYGDYFVVNFPAEVLPDDACELKVPPQNSPTPLNKMTICRRSLDPFFPKEITTQSYLLGPADAIVLHLCTPPPSKHFSLDGYISSRFPEGADEFSPGTNYGDTVNQCTIGVPSGEPVFDEPSVIIQTADGGAAKTISTAFEGEGVDPATITTHALDSSMLRLWDRSQGDGTWAGSHKPDTLFSIFRVSIYDGDLEGDASLREAYQKETWPVSFYFAADDASAEEPLVPELAPRAVEGLSELHLLDAMAALEASVRARFSPSSPTSEFPTTTTIFNYSGLDYQTSGTYDDWQKILSLQNNKTYQVATRDAVYGEPPAFERDPLDDDGSNMPPLAMLSGDLNAAVVFGTLHTHEETFGAAYMELGVDVLSLSGTDYLFSVWLTEANLAGSALRYLQGTPYEDLADQLFAVDVMPPGLCANSSSNSAGNDKPSWCVEIVLTTGGTTMVGMLLVPAERCYAVNSDKCIGPDVDSLVPTQAIVFDLIGTVRDPCEGQFGTFACSQSTLSGDYELVYGVGCDSNCDVNCSQYVTVATNPALSDYGTCHTDTDADTGAVSSMRLTCDPNSGDFLGEFWDDAGGCLGVCSEQSVPEVATSLCFASDDSSGCNVTAPFPVVPCSASPGETPRNYRENSALLRQLGGGALKRSLGQQALLTRSIMNK